MRAVILLLIIWYTGFADYNNDGQRSDSEPLIAGLYELHHHYPNGGVEMTIVEQAAGQWMFITPRPGHRYALVTTCAVVNDVQALPDETRLYVPMTCAQARVWLPVVMGEHDGRE